MKQSLIIILLFFKTSSATNIQSMPDDIIYLFCKELSNKSLGETLRFLRLSKVLYKKSDAILLNIIPHLSTFSFQIFSELPIRQRLVLIQDYQPQNLFFTNKELLKDIGNLIGQIVVSYIGCECGNLIFTKDMKVYCWKRDENRPKVIEGDLKNKKVIQALKKGHNDYLTLSTDGHIYSMREMSSPFKVKDLNNKKIAFLALSHNDEVLAITKDGEIFLWRHDDLPSITEGLFNDEKVIAIRTFTRPATQYSRYSLALTKEGHLYEWTVSIDNAIKVQRLIDKKIILVSCGYNHILALSIDGEVYAWGDNTFGQLGIPYLLKINFPMLVDTKKMAYVHAEKDFSKAITIDGQVFVWGKNNRYQLGLKHNKNVTVPTLRK